MYQIQVSNKNPNQKFNVTTDYGTLEIELRTIEDMILMSVSSNGKYIVNSIKVAPNVPLIGYKHLQEQYGDFIFTTSDNEYPYFENFNNANKLYWLNYKEIQNYKNGTI